MSAKGWQTKRLDEVASIIRGVTYSSGQILTPASPNSLRLLRATNIQDGKLDTNDPVYIPQDLVKPAQMLQKLDIVIASSSGSIQVVGKSASVLQNIEATFGAFCTGIRATTIDPRYLGHYLQDPTLRQKWSDLASGSNINNLKSTDMASTLIPVPPLDEQRRIVETLDVQLSRLDKALAELDHSDSQTHVLRRSMMNELLNPALSGLERGIRQMNTESSPWETRTLKDWGMEAQTGFASGVHNQTQDGVAHLRPMNVSRNGVIELGEVKYVSAAAGKHRLESGDILFNNTNSDVLVGKTALFSNQGEYAFSNHMTRLRFPNESVYPKFMASRLHYLWMEGYFKSICNNHVSQASVSTKALADIQVALPPLDEQQRIVLTQDASLSRLDFTRTSIASQKTSLQTLRRSLLNKAFKGELGTH